ncbi:restriction endonuclease subunit S [Mycoplasma seminis]|uniref:Restriction endonuclease subunit S n=1 Tax=Mycoplasma seminis TaxID=512749 RepID=A0ABY9HAS5_9MOLU|nr:restriction endonuclease subunit S [Mycoplasma seminis]WLP85697.1 restriction endonuclease subunit S [Mycoplasma seminis]
MNKKITKPQIRFKGFTNTWEKYSINEVTINLDKYRIPIAENLRIKGNIPYYGANGILGYVNGFTHDGENVLVAEDGANDLLNYPVNYTTGKIWVNNHAHVLKGKSNILDNKFLCLSLKRSEISSLIVGGSRAKLNKNYLLNLSISITKYAEQILLGQLFYNLDNILAFYKRKLEKLQNIKNSLLINIFATEKSPFPKIRFKGFTNPWEKKNIDSYGSAISGTSLEAEFNNFGDLKVISIGSFSDNSLYNDQGIRASLNNKTVQKLLNKDDLVMILNDKTQAGNIIGRVLLIDENNKYVFNQRVQRIIVDKSRYIPSFIYNLINNPRNRNKIFMHSQGNTQIYVNWSNIKEIEFYIPDNKDEQIIISTFFDKLNSLITSYNHKLEKLENIKKSLLEKMFC